MIIDVHTHMLSQDWLDLLVERSGAYTLRDAPGGARAVYRGGTAFMTLTPGMFDYDLRIAEMDKAGVDLAIVSLTCPSVYWGGEEVSVRGARMINDHMAAERRRRPDRIGFLATLPWQYPAAAVAELERACELGAAGVMVLANIDGRSLTDPAFADVWRAIDERALPVLVHPTTPPGVEDMDIERYHLVWSVGFTFDTTLALARMVLDGFLERYPNLKIIGSHAAGTLPFLMGRLDTGHRSFAAAREAIAEIPSTYAGRVYADSIAYSPASLALTVEVLGERNVLFGSDYPHKCGRMDECVDLVATLPAAQADLVRSGNAARIFDLG